MGSLTVRLILALVDQGPRGLNGFARVPLGKTVPVTIKVASFFLHDKPLTSQITFHRSLHYGDRYQKLGAQEPH